MQIDIYRIEIYKRHTNNISATIDQFKFNDNCPKNINV